MSALRSSLANARRLPYGLREVLVVLLGFGCAAALVLAAQAPSQDPVEAGQAALAREGAAATGAALGVWGELRRSDALLEAQPPLWWSTEDVRFEPAVRYVSSATTPAQRATDAFLGEARFLSGGDPTEARGLLAEALNLEADRDRVALIQLELLRLAVAQGESETAFEAWKQIEERGDGSLAEDGVSIELLAALVLAPTLGTEARAQVLGSIAQRWCDGELALPKPRGALRGSGEEFDLRSSLRLALTALFDDALLLRWDSELDRRAALERGALVCAPGEIRVRATGAEGFASIPPVESEARESAVLFARPRSDRGFEGAFLALSELLPMLEEGARERGGLAGGFGFALLADTESATEALAAETNAGIGQTRLPGTPYSLVVPHEDRAGFLAAAGQRARRMRLALSFMAVVVGLAGLVMARMLARSGALLRARTTFVASVSHELRTPLASILLMAENLEEGRVTDDARRAKYHSSIRREAARLRRLVEDVLDLARAERGEAPQLSPTSVKLAPFAKELEETLQQRAETRGGTLTFKAAQLGDGAWIDAEALTRAAANMVENAVVHGRSEEDDAAPRAVDVRLDCPRAGELRLSVRDHGPGLSARARARAFEPFARLAPRIANRPGAGLGLAIVREIARAHGGQAQFRTPTDGPGLIVELTLPVANPNTKLE